MWNPESKTVLDYFTCNVIWFVSITLIFFFFWGGGGVDNCDDSRSPARLLWKQAYKDM